MKSVSNDFKTLSKKVKQQDLKISINDGELTVGEVHMMPIHIFDKIPIRMLKARKKVFAKELVYSFEGELFKTIMQQIDIKVKNVSEIKDKKIDVKYGIFINNKFEYVNVGEYKIKDIEDDKNKEEITATGYDKMLNFMIPFKQSDLQLTYPCKMKELVSKMCETCKVEAYNLNFFNADLLIEEDFFTVQQLTYRDVLEKIAQATLTTIFIKENKLYFCKIDENIVQELDTSYLSDLSINEKFGPLNALVLGRGSVEDNIESTDIDSINIYGRNEIRFDENELLDNKRETVIDDMLEEIKRLEYYSFEAKNIGLMWLDPCDVLLLKDRENNEYKSILLSAKITITMGISGNIESNIPEVSTTKYKVTSKEEKKNLKVERLAKKHEGIIQDIIEEQGEYDSKLIEVTQNLEGIKEQVKSVMDFTREVNANGTLHLNNCATGRGYVTELSITDIKYLTPSENLVPSEYLVPFGDYFTLVVDKADRYSKTTEVFEAVINLEKSLKRLSDTVFDEININEKGEINLIRRIGKNAATGNLYQLAKETIEVLGTVALPTFEPDTYIYIKETPNVNLYSKYIIKSEFSDVYARKVELNTAIEQTNTTIMQEVNKKVNDEDFGTKIIQDFESVKIAWNNISEFIKFITENNKAILAILDDNNNKLSTFDSTGQHFYDNNKIIADMGIIDLANDETDPYMPGLFFILDTNQLSNGAMGWAYKTIQEDGTIKYTPYIWMRKKRR